MITSQHNAHVQLYATNDDLISFFFSPPFKNQKILQLSDKNITDITSERERDRLI